MIPDLKDCANYSSDMQMYLLRFGFVAGRNEFLQVVPSFDRLAASIETHDRQRRLR
jgi:hypothetical protein